MCTKRQMSSTKERDSISRLVSAHLLGGYLSLCSFVFSLPALFLSHLCLSPSMFTAALSFHPSVLARGHGWLDRWNPVHTGGRARRCPPTVRRYSSLQPPRPMPHPRGELLFLGRARGKGRERSPMQDAGAGLPMVAHDRSMARVPRIP